MAATAAAGCAPEAGPEPWVESYAARPFRILAPDTVVAPGQRIWVTVAEGMGGVPEPDDLVLGKQEFEPAVCWGPEGRPPERCQVRFSFVRERPDIVWRYLHPSTGQVQWRADWPDLARAGFEPVPENLFQDLCELGDDAFVSDCVVVRVYAPPEATGMLRAAVVGGRETPWVLEADDSGGRTGTIHRWTDGNRGRGRPHLSHTLTFRLPGSE